MSEQLTVVCPHCAFSKVVPKGAIPEAARQATCPKCKQSFSLNSDTLRAYAAPPDTPVNQAPVSPPPVPAAAVNVPPPLPPVPAQQSTTPPLGPAPRTLGFSFHGSARDYFGIWIVNTLLKILTLGMYSAWAKVRKRRFFYGSTTLHDQPFEYLADPMALFKGWLIAATAFILYSIGTKVSPILSGVIALIVFVAFPWLVVRSRIFNAANSSYRNIRFGFRPNYREAYVVFAGLTILSMLSLGLMFPYALYRQKKFIVENSTYGSTPFSFSATARDFYILSLKVALGFIAVFGLIGIIVALSGVGLVSAATAGGAGKALSGLAIIPFLSLTLVYFIIMVYGQTALANLSWNGTRMGSGCFRSTLRTRDMALLFVTNALAILFSLGLLVPWATVRMARYRFQHLELDAAAGLDDVIAAAGSGYSVGAAGDEISDVFDMPLDIAL
ncbi:MAG: DUF898 family protein [Desulfuromonadales bacterium]|nr:DUF898 family protein [Desulfuromonadales bacterium]